MPRIKLRTFDQRFNDPSFLGDLVAQDLRRIRTHAVDGLMPLETPPDSRASDGRKTVIIHGKRVSAESPKKRWPSAELWGVSRCNVLYWRESLTDWDRWFDLHPPQPTAHHRGILAKRPEAWAWYTRQSPDRPIYLLEPHPEVPASVAFPRDAVQARFPTTRFTVSVDWMIALALMEGFDRIVLNGIGTRFEPDYQYAHRGILYWLGYAEGKGIDLVIEGPSCYAVPEKVYGYEAAAPEWQPQAQPA